MGPVSVDGRGRRWQGVTGSCVKPGADKKPGVSKAARMCGRQPASPAGRRRGSGVSGALNTDLESGTAASAYVVGLAHGAANFLVRKAKKQGGSRLTLYGRVGTPVPLGTGPCVSESSNAGKL